MGRAYRSRGKWIFDPARRWRGGRRELTWSGSTGPEDGDHCIAEVPDDGPARLVEVLGADDRPEWDDRSVASQYRLRTFFSPQVEREVGRLAEPAAKDFAGRVDLRERLTFTIDGVDFLKLVTGNASGPRMFMFGKLGIEGRSHRVSP